MLGGFLLRNRKKEGITCGRSETPEVQLCQTPDSPIAEALEREPTISAGLSSLPELIKWIK